VLTPGLKSPVLISTFARIGTLYLGWTLALTCNGKWALWSCHTLEVSLSYFRVRDSEVIVVATHREVPTSKSLHGCWCGRGGKSEPANSLLTSKSTKSEDFQKMPKVTISSKKPQITPVDIVFRFIIQYNRLRDFGP
jgi:hypothetical protein